MALKKYPTKTGATALRDTDKNEYAGSIGAGKDRVPTSAEGAPASSLVSETAEAEVDTMFERFQEHRRLLAERLNEELPEPPAPYEEVAYGLARSLPIELDEAQYEDVYRLLTNAVGRKTDDELPAPTEEEWQEWLDKCRARLADESTELSDADRARLLAQVESAAAGERPNGREFAMVTKLEAKLWVAQFSLNEGYQQISAWFDASAIDVKWQVEKYRKEYLEAEARGEAPEIDQRRRTRPPSTGIGRLRIPSCMILPRCPRSSSRWTRRLRGVTPTMRMSFRSVSSSMTETVTRLTVSSPTSARRCVTASTGLALKVP